jgi:hypothetical protein
VFQFLTTDQFIVSVQGSGDAAELIWVKRPQQEGTRKLLEQMARARVTLRYEWLERLGNLVATVKRWAEELDWATKVVQKRIEDAEIGNYKAPALLLQEEAVRLFLEPIARDVPGGEGLVDLYLMPSYDDIASLYYYNGRWNVHYLFDGTSAVGNIRDAEAKPLTKATLRRVLDEMKAHAG